MTNEQYYDCIQPYQNACQIMRAKLEVLNGSLYRKSSVSPIHNIQERIKSKKSIEKKLEKLGHSDSVQNAKDHLRDIAGIRVIRESGVKIHACSHITGGGFYENIPRMLKEGTRAVVKKDSYPVLPIFKLLAEKGNIDEHMMYNTYNMGLGMILAVDPADVDKTMEAIRKTGDKPYVVGSIEEGEKGVTLC